MTDVTITMYQLVTVVYSLIIPLALILGMFWIIVKMLKGFVRSVMK